MLLPHYIYATTSPQRSVGQIRPHSTHHFRPNHKVKAQICLSTQVFFNLDIFFVFLLFLEHSCPAMINDGCKKQSVNLRFQTKFEFCF